MKTFVHYFILGFLLIQCHSTSDKNSEIEVSNVQWKYGEGLNVGDWLEFSGDVYRIESDTIFKKDIAIAVVLKIKKGQLGDDDEMEIVSINGEKKGIYHSK